MSSKLLVSMISCLFVMFWIPTHLNSQAIYDAETWKKDYDEIMTNATNDAVQQLIRKSDEYSSDLLGDGVDKVNYQKINLNLDRALERFYDTLYINLNIDRNYASQQALKVQTPIKIVVGYDGYYVDHWNNDGNGEQWTEKKLYTMLDQQNNLVIRFTLDDYVYVTNTETNEAFEGLRKNIELKYPSSCLASEKDFNEIKSQVINQMIERDLEYYTSKTNEIALRNGWQLNFKVPYWGDRTVDGISFVAFIQGTPSVGVNRFNSYGFSTTKLIKNRTVYGYEVNGEKLYSYKKTGSNIMVFSNVYEAASNGYYPDSNYIK